MQRPAVSKIQEDNSTTPIVRLHVTDCACLVCTHRQDPAQSGSSPLTRRDAMLGVPARGLRDPPSFHSMRRLYAILRPGRLSWRECSRQALSDGQNELMIPTRKSRRRQTCRPRGQNHLQPLRSAVPCGRLPVSIESTRGKCQRGVRTT